MDVVLGVVMTMRDARFLLVEGERGDGAIIDHDSFEAHSAAGVEQPGFSENVVSAVLGTYAAATANGYTVRRVAVCWTDAVDTEAGLVLDALDQLGIANVVVVPAAEAVEAAAEHFVATRAPESVALCVVEPDVAALTVVCGNADGLRQVRSQTLTGAGRAAIVRALHRACVSAAAPVESIVLAGRVPDMGMLVTEVSSATSRSVTLAEDASLLLGRGALLADVAAPVVEPEPAPTKAVFVPRAARLAALPAPVEETVVLGPRSPRLANALSGVLVVAMVTLVVSVSLAITKQFPSSDDDRPVERRVVQTASEPAEPAAPAPVEPPALMALPEPHPNPAAAGAPMPIAAGPQLPPVAPPPAGGSPLPPPVQGALQQVAQQVLPPAMEVAKNPITVPNTDITLPPLTDIVAQYKP